MSVKPKRVKARARPYRYYVGKGNNPDLVREIMSTRDWWEELSQEELEAGVPYNFKWKQLNYRKSELETLGSVRGVRQCVNHFENNMELCSKSGLFKNITYFYERVLQKDVFEAIPVTFNFTSLRDPEYSQFLECYHECNRIKQLTEAGQAEQTPESTPNGTAEVKLRSPSIKVREETGSEEKRAVLAYNFKFSNRVVLPSNTAKNVWILKPGHGTNRAIGIKVFHELKELEEHIEKWNSRKHAVFNWVVQKYMERPLLINNRKFDIRAYAVVTHALDLYFYEEGYLRTSGEAYDLDNLEDRNVHLTNWAVQKKSLSYGDHEDANQLNFTQFQEYLDEHYATANISVEKDLKSKMKELVLHSMLAGGTSFNLNNHKYCIELLGYDFMVDDEFRVCLIEVNNNPCLCTPGDATGELIPKLLQDMMTIALDPLFPAVGDPLCKAKPKLEKTNFVLLNNASDKATMLLREKQRKEALQQRKEVSQQRKQVQESAHPSPQRAPGRPRLPSHRAAPVATPELALRPRGVEREPECVSSESEEEHTEEEPLMEPLAMLIPVAPKLNVNSVRVRQPAPKRPTAKESVMACSEQPAQAWSPGLRVTVASKSGHIVKSPHLERPQLSRMDLSAGLGIFDTNHQSVELQALQHRHLLGQALPTSVSVRRAPPCLRSTAISSHLPGIGSPPVSQRRRAELNSAGNESLGTPHRMVREAAGEAEEVARQLRDAGMVKEACQLERLRVELLQPGTDLTAKKNEARTLAERLRTQARERQAGHSTGSSLLQRATCSKSRFQLHVETLSGDKRSSTVGGLPAVCGTTCSLSPSVVNIG